MKIDDELKDTATQMKEAMRGGKWQLIAPDGRLYQVEDARELVAILFHEFDGVDINKRWDTTMSSNT